MVSHFLSLVKGLDVKHLARLLQCGKGLPGVYLYDPVTRTTAVPKKGQLSWEVEFLLRNHRKHIYGFVRKPSLEQISTSLTDMSNRLAWRHHLKNQPPNPWRHIASRPVRPRQYPDELPQPLRAYVDEVTSTVWQSCLKARLRSSPQPPLPGAVKLAFEKLKRGIWGILPTDKDGGFAVVNKIRLSIAIFRTLDDRQYYTPVDASWRHAQDVCAEYRDACRHIASVGNDEMDQQMFRALVSASGTPEDIYFKFGATAKTHKPQGQCKLRGLHCMQPRSPLSPAMKFVSSMLRPHLAQLDHLVKDSSHFLRRLRSLRFTTDVTMVKIDVKEYFMSGSHDVLVTESSRFLRGDEREQYRIALQFILANQFVTVPGCDDMELWQVTCGSGMGMICSGEVSDASFYQLAERRWLQDDEYKSMIGLAAYFRFKDDIIAFFDGLQQDRDRFLRDLSTWARPFSLELESVSSQEIPFLDVKVHKRAGFSGGTLDYRVHVKRSSQWIPLGDDSLHPPSVHRAWPAAMISRYYRLCSNADVARSHAADFARRLRAAGTSSSITEALFHNSPTVRSVQQSNFVGPPQARVMHVVFPFFRVWHNASIPAILGRLNARWSGMSGYSLRASWKLGDRHLLTRLVALNVGRDERYLQYSPVFGGWMG